MKRILQIALFAAAGFMSINGARAQGLASAYIPFDFTVQHKIMPPGTYVVESAGEKAIQLRSVDGKFHEFSLVSAADRIGGNGGKLVFHRYGGQYFLTEIQTPWDTQGLQLPTTKAEKYAQANEASLRNDGIAVVAMK